jgi:hypothetical protein
VRVRSGRFNELACSTISEERPLGRLLRQRETLKARIRAKVEHPFHVIKNLFHFKKVRYKGLAKNTAQLSTCCSGWPIWCSPSGVFLRFAPKLRPDELKMARKWRKVVKMVRQSAK